MGTRQRCRTLRMGHNGDVIHVYNTRARGVTNIGNAKRLPSSGTCRITSSEHVPGKNRIPSIGIIPENTSFSKLNIPPARHRNGQAPVLSNKYKCRQKPETGNRIFQNRDFLPELALIEICPLMEITWNGAENLDFRKCDAQMRRTGTAADPVQGT
jgi:hypothetical protein